MKIIYACNSDFGKHGGIGFRTYHVAKEAEKRNNLLKVIARGNKQEEIEVVKNGNRLFSLGLAFLQQYISKHIHTNNLNRKVYEKLAIGKLEKCDIFHCYDSNPSLIKKAKELGAIVVLDTQMGCSKEGRIVLDEENKKYGLKREESTAEEESVELADYIICASDFVKETFMKHGTPESKLKVFNQGVDIEKFKPIERKLTTKPIFLFVGIIEPRKGIEYLIKAFEEVPQAKLLLVGRKNKTMGDLKLPKNVNLIGQTNNINEYYNTADVFILPSLFESSAKVLYEAASCGLPIITTPNSGPFFKDRTAGMIIPIKDYKAIKYAVQHYVEHPMHIREMGRTGRKIVESLTWKHYGEKINDWYEEIKCNV